MIHRAISRVLVICFALSMASNASAQISKSVGLLKGEVTLADGTPLANVPVIVFRETERLTSTKSNPEGKVTAILQPNATYRVSVNSTGYMFQEDTIRVPSLSAYQEFPLHIVLTPLHDGQTFDLSVPVFEPRSRDIASAALPELNRVADELRHNPKLTVSVIVYPDAPVKFTTPVKSKRGASARPTHDAQESLASSRETSMRSYFLGKNVPDSRFTVESVTTTVPEGRFPMPAGLQVTSKASKSSGRKKKSVAEAEPTLFPQYVEILAHVAS
jgi:hypothetical protein